VFEDMSAMCQFVWGLCLIVGSRPHCILQAVRRRCQSRVRVRRRLLKHRVSRRSSTSSRVCSYTERRDVQEARRSWTAIEFVADRDCRVGTRGAFGDIQCVQRTHVSSGQVGRFSVARRHRRQYLPSRPANVGNN
jgi:hypothetical protein